MARTNMDPGPRTFRALMLLIPAAYGIFAIFAAYYSNVDYMPGPFWPMFGLKALCAYVFVYWGFVLLNLRRSHRIRGYRRFVEMYSSSLASMGKRPSPIPGLLEIVAVITIGLGAAAGMHLAKLADAPLYFILLPLALLAYCAMTAAALHIWRVRKQKNVL